MKIVLTGGGTGGHVYPVFAIIEELQKINNHEHIARFQTYFFSDNPYDEKRLFELHTKYINIPAGKLRLYPSIQNFFDIFKTGYGVAEALIRLFFIYPDVVFGKGGYASFPTVFAARLLGRTA